MSLFVQEFGPLLCSSMGCLFSSCNLLNVMWLINLLLSYWYIICYDVLLVCSEIWPSTAMIFAILLYWIWHGICYITMRRQYIIWYNLLVCSGIWASTNIGFLLKLHYQNLLCFLHHQHMFFASLVKAFSCAYKSNTADHVGCKVLLVMLLYRSSMWNMQINVEYCYTPKIVPVVDVILRIEVALQTLPSVCDGCKV